MHTKLDGIVNEVRTASELQGTGLTRAEILVRWVLIAGFVAVLLTEAWLLWRAWAQLF